MSDEMKPAAWGIAWSHDDLDCEHVYESRDNAKAVADNGNGSIIPLYRQQQPRLTDEEREAIEVAARFMDKWGGVPNTIVSSTLRGLLERHGGCPEREQPARKDGAMPARGGENGGDSPERA